MLNKYISSRYDSSREWFKEEVSQSYHQNRIQKIIANKEYLDGKHKIQQRADEIWNQKHFEVRKIVLDYAQMILDFQATYLLKNPVTLVSNDLEALEQYKKVYREGKYHKADYDILHKLVRYGEVAEYIYIDDNGRIKSKLIDPIDSYPVYNAKGEYIAFIEHYISEGVPFYTVYSDTAVEEYSVLEDDVMLTGVYANVSGLPVVYRLESETDSLTGRSDLDRWKNIIDNMEDILSKYTDGLYKHIGGVGVLSGEKLNVDEQGRGGIDPHVVGAILQLESGSSFSYATNKLDNASFSSLWKNLINSLLNVSATPSIAINGAEVSNVSESSVRMMYEIANVRSADNSRRLEQGFERRWGIMKKLMRLLGYDIAEEAYISCSFNTAVPESRTGIINDLVKATGGKPIMSVERAIEVNPFTSDVVQEIDRLRADTETDVNNDGINDVD